MNTHSTYNNPLKQVVEVAHRAEQLRQVTEWISGELALQPLLTRIVDSATALLQAHYGSIGLVVPTPAGPVVEIAAISNMPADELGARMPVGRGLAGRVLATQEPVIVARYGDLDEPTLPDLAHHAVIGVPIWWAERMIGFFGIGSEPPHRFGGEDVHTLELFARHAAVAIHNARTFEAERRRASRVAIINKINRLITTSLSPRDVFQITVDAIHHQLGFAYVAAGLVDDNDPSMLVLYAQQGMHAANVPSDYRHSIHHGIIGEAARTQQHVLVNNVAHDDRYLPLLGANTIQAELAVPIVLGDTLLGVLNIESEQPISEQDVQGVAIIADQLAIAIHNARRYEREQQRTARLELIARLGQRIAARLDARELWAMTTDELHTQLGYDHVSLFLIDGRDDQYLVQHAHASAWPRPDEIGYRQPVGHGLLGTAARERRPILVHDVGRDGRYVPIPGAPPHLAELAVPIVLDDRALGVLDVASMRQLSEEDVTAIQIIADQLAITIDNARRYAEEQQRTARLQLIARVGQRIAARLQPTALFTTTVAELHHQLGYDHAAIFLLDQADPRWLVKRATVSRWPGNPPGHRQHIEHGLMGAAARQRHAVLVNDVRADERIVPIPGGTDMHAEVAIPLVLGDRLLGVLDVGSVEPLHGEDVTAIGIVADQLATAIDNTRLFADTEHALSTTQLLYATSQALSSALDTDEVIAGYLQHVAVGSGYTCLVGLLGTNDDGATGTVRGCWTPSNGAAITNMPLPLDADVAATLQMGQLLFIDDTQRDSRVALDPTLPPARALVMIPLIVRAQWIGTVVVCSPHPHTWRTADWQAYQVTAAPLAVALDSRQQQMLLAERGQHVAVLEERQRLARDLHDSVTQELFSMTLIAQALAPAWRRAPAQGEQRVARLLDISQTALAEMRALLIELRPPTVAAAPSHTPAGHTLIERDGLVAALRAHGGEQQRDGLTIMLHANGYVPQQAEHEIALYRIVQEALANVRKHARTDRAAVQVRVDDEQVHLRIKDGGQGFVLGGLPRAGHARTTGGFGLLSMRERAEALGGGCAITTAPTQGTLVDVWIPRNDRR